ncbi:MAG: M20/M25/M40 family metallo-hydrolase [Bifidobacteriaceae bacterium]|jgi:acetylornithine deacetylase/succinyl-diaminopimelate desuccinylase-like protein|nr:M20/M25/M40 family metallo-hydrolase [Bifidobacteriaceae bacterium]
METPATSSAARPTEHPAADDAIRIARDLIRFDTTNTGDERSAGEREAAEYVTGLLQDWGCQPAYFESEPRRGSVVVRLEGQDQTRPALVLHGHLDVVPANAAEWQADPFGAEIRDGAIWGRGAVDMKDMDAMILAVVGWWRDQGVKPPRDIVLCFFADEEAGGALGSRWLVRNHPELFAGATEAVSEVGGFSVSVAGRRAYLIQTAEKGIAWLKLVSKGTPGHGSAINQDNAVRHLVDALARIAAQPWTMNLTPTVEAMLRGAADLAGVNLDLTDRQSVDQLLDAFGAAKRFVGASVATGVNLTSLHTGSSKVNVVPRTAEGTIDMRPLPGEAADAKELVTKLAGPHIDISPLNEDIALEAPLDAPVVAAMKEALTAADPSAAILPYMLAGGTDGKALARLGIASYGFAPLRLPDTFDFTAMFHGVDERVPIDSLRWGAGVLADFLGRI